MLLEISETIYWKSDKKLNLTLDPQSNTTSQSDSSDYEEVSSVASDTSSNMATMQALDVIKLVNSTLKPFSGAAGELASLLVNLEILKAAIPAEHASLGIKCVRGKLEGAAAGFVPPNAPSYSDTIKFELN